MHPESELKLFTKWDQFFQTILNLKGTLIKCPTILKYLELRENAENEGNTLCCE